MRSNRNYGLLCLAVVAVASNFLCWPVSARARDASEAQLTRIVEDVRIENGAASRPAVIHDRLTAENPLRTGARSWAELIFANHTVVRLAQQSLFSFTERRQLNLHEGALLVQAPNEARGYKVKLDAVSADVAGTTSVCEVRGGVYKFFVLQGTARLYRPGHLGDSVLIRPGEMVFGQTDKPLSDPVDVDIGRFATTSRFLLDFSPLQTADRIARESEKQQRSKAKKKLIGTNLVIFGSGTSVSVMNPASPSTPTSSQPAPSATPLATAVLREIESSPRAGR